jgi:hypothetical protein
MFTLAFLTEKRVRERCEVKRPRDNGEERNLFAVWVEKNRKMRLDEEEGCLKRRERSEIIFCL